MLSGCGSAPAAPPPATHDDFRAIQRHEATIADARPRAAETDRPCEEACAAIHEACEAADAICRIADDTSDLDALARCESGRDACRDIGTDARARCTCRDHG